MPHSRSPCWLAVLSLACGETDGAHSRHDRADAATHADDAGAGGAAPVRVCNGHPELCDRRYDEVAFPATHNAHSARAYGYNVNANQISGIEKQLADGIRVMLLDVYTDGDAGTVFCHGFCSLGETPHLVGLQQVKAFLDANPDEVVTFIYEDHVPAEIIAADMDASGLTPMALVHQNGDSWPTLRWMLDHGSRLVVTAETAGPPPSWLHHVWDVAFDTPYTFLAEAEFSCELNRGSATNGLFLLNHWLSTSPPLNLPTEDGAKLVNAAAVLGARAALCQEQSGHLPNFVAVDFYEDGDLFQVVDALNGF